MNFNQSSSLHVTCALGLADYLSAEISALKMPVVKLARNHVISQGNLQDCLKLNLMLRTAYRVHYELISAPCTGQAEFKALLKQFNWEEVMGVNGCMTFQSFSNHPTIRNSMFLNQFAKDAVADYFKARSGKRPDSGKLNDSAVSLFVHWVDNHLKVYLDTTGIPLDKRGYRLDGLYAPMQETLAAALIMATGWNKTEALYNPMCGSGTLAIEAAMMAAGIFPGLLRRNYALMNVNGYRQEYCHQILDELQKASSATPKPLIKASDQSSRAVAAAKQNAKRAGVEEWIDFSVNEFENSPMESGSGMVILNPPYGQRLGEEEQLLPLYKAIGSFFKKNCSGKTCFVFTGSRTLSHQIGLRASRKMPFYNGDIECRLLRYEMYEGSKKNVN